MTAPPREISLDVLRAVAVLLVLVRHSPAEDMVGPGVFSTLLRAVQRGGWVGVDLFFVLSGFLISGLLFGEYQRTGKISVKRFLVRRGLKIYPPFYVLMAVTVLQGIWAAGRVPPSLLLSEIFYVQNYFPRMWDHTWSLAVEEHFYFSLPAILLVMLWRGGEKPFRRFPLLVYGVAFACLAARAWTSYSRAYVFDTHVAPTHLRADALMWGCLLSYAWHFAPERFESLARRFRPLLLATGLLCLLPPFLVPLEHPLMVVAGLTLFYLGSGFLLVALFRTIRPTRAARFAAFIGRHSYSIYLWHFAVFIWLVPLTEIAAGFALPPEVSFPYYMVSACLIGIAMARAVEFPVLKLRDRWFPAPQQDAVRVPASAVTV